MSTEGNFAQIEDEFIKDITTAYNIFFDGIRLIALGIYETSADVGSMVRSLLTRDTQVDSKQTPLKLDQAELVQAEIDR